MYRNMCLIKNKMIQMNMTPLHFSFVLKYATRSHYIIYILFSSIKNQYWDTHRVIVVLHIIESWFQHDVVLNINRHCIATLPCLRTVVTFLKMKKK